MTVTLLSEDRFSKACHHVPLEGLPTAPQTAEVLFQYVVPNKGIPEENVSDRGPQFTTHICLTFFNIAHFSKHQRLEPYAYFLHDIAYFILLFFLSGLHTLISLARILITDPLISDCGSLLWCVLR